MVFLEALNLHLQIAPKFCGACLRCFRSPPMPSLMSFERRKRKIVSTHLSAVSWAAFPPKKYLPESNNSARNEDQVPRRGGCW
ncbi:MAG TPA: hypothetical protein DC054_15345 [Blastocatellia bacterium]|nr:hypothetical protein [Blastocatellia bacterium]